VSAVRGRTATEEPGSAGTEERASEASRPAVIRVESGTPTPEEIAALVAVLSALHGGDEPPAERPRSAWSDPSWRLVGPSRARGGWRASGLPR
jgi:hypothetical protein